MAEKIITIKKIALLDTAELRYATFKGVDKFDIRVWKSEDKYEDGVRFTAEEIDALYNLVSLGKDGTVGVYKFEKVDDHYSFSVTARDGRVAHRDMSELDIKMFKKVCINARLQSKDIKKPIHECLLEYDVAKEVDKIVAEKKSKKTTSKATKAASTNKKETKQKAKVVQFPKERVAVDPIPTEGSATYEECVEKLQKDREMFKDQDSQYVIDGLLELAKVDSNFRNRIMLSEKSYAGAFEYFAKLAQQGYAMKFGSVSFLDNDMALGMAIDYYNEDIKKEAK